MKTNKLYLPKKFRDEFMTAQFTIDAPIYHHSFNDGNVEYVETSSLWHKPDEVPEHYPCVLLCRYTYYKNDEDLYLTISKERFVSERDYLVNFKEVRNAVTWCDLEDLLPKGGEE